MFKPYWYSLVPCNRKIRVTFTNIYFRQWSQTLFAESETVIYLAFRLSSFSARARQAPRRSAQRVKLMHRASFLAPPSFMPAARLSIKAIFSSRKARPNTSPGILIEKHTESVLYIPAAEHAEARFRSSAMIPAAARCQSEFQQLAPRWEHSTPAGLGARWELQNQNVGRYHQYCMHAMGSLLPHSKNHLFLQLVVIAMH